ncbi:MAG TPA: hypothetical protein VJ867_02500 [Gemmatimonadaceae bacterium]|nr:hypothetical protein [Gemmatimonadaceae bacterium]
MRNRHAQRCLLAALFALTACGPVPQDDRPRKRATATKTARVDSAIPAEFQTSFQAPASWDTVRLSRGLVYHEPPRFGLGLSDATLTDCDSAPSADVPVFNQTIADRWPLTLALRRGDQNIMARANGFVLDSVRPVALGQSAGDSLRIRRGEGWMLASGRTQSHGTPLDILFGTVRYPGGCYLVLAARGVDISVDTLGMVLSTIRYNR